MFHVYVPELICDHTIALPLVFDLNSAFMYLYPRKPNIKEYIGITLSIPLATEGLESCRMKMQQKKYKNISLTSNKKKMEIDFYKFLYFFTYLVSFKSSYSR